MKNSTRSRTLYMIPVLLAASLFAACDTSTGMSDIDGGDVTIQFSTSGSASAKTAQASATNIQTGDTLRIQGTNGILEIYDLRFIVEDFKLEHEDADCEDNTSGNSSCNEFESDPFFVDLPLNAETISLDTSPVDQGLYNELEFEIDDLDLDEEDDDDREAKQRLAGQIRAEFPDWPKDASMLIIGSFITANNDTLPFKTYAEADIELEFELTPPLMIGENAPESVLRVQIEPHQWFRSSNGQVMDLTIYDYTSTRRLLEFEVEIENGFRSIEVDDDHDDDDDNS